MYFNIEERNYKITNASVDFDEYSKEWRIIIENRDVFVEFFPLKLNGATKPDDLLNQVFDKEDFRYSKVCEGETVYLISHLIMKTMVTNDIKIMQVYGTGILLEEEDIENEIHFEFCVDVNF